MTKSKSIIKTRTIFKTFERSNITNIIIILVIGILFIICILNMKFTGDFHVTETETHTHYSGPIDCNDERHKDEVYCHPFDR